ncbi:hypothetical protein SASPL_137864 [Salvia splendens]|uniref:Uncharacterized protein n=1 Tax=Salvia splendens TaxID=180675 RepID=A0A8X8WVM1_SALSN|nr:hypothetical protein SASPL_137864 [Salvia splendens]
MVTYSNRIHRSVPPLPNEDIIVDIEEEEEDGSASGHETMGMERKGEPIGGEKSKLCHFLGSIARNGRYCPLDVNNWRAMPKGKKDDMLEFVKQGRTDKASTKGEKGPRIGGVDHGGAIKQLGGDRWLLEEEHVRK